MYTKTPWLLCAALSVGLFLGFSNQAKAQLENKGLAVYGLFGKTSDERVYADESSEYLPGRINGFGFQGFGQVKNWEYSLGIEFTNYGISQYYDEFDGGVAGVAEAINLRLSAGRLFKFSRVALGLHALVNIGYNGQYDWSSSGSEPIESGNYNLSFSTGFANASYVAFADAPFFVTGGLKASLAYQLNPRFALELAYRYEHGFVTFNRYEVDATTHERPVPFHYKALLDGSHSAFEVKLRFYIQKQEIK